MRLARSLLRVFFRHFYTTLAWSYDFVARFVSVGQWMDWVRSIINPYPADPILEIAHGPGHLLLELNQRSEAAFGIDASRQMCKMASRRLRSSGLDSTVVQAQAQALPFPRNTFLTLLSTFPTEFIMDPSSLAEARRTLLPDGEYRIVPMAEIRGPGTFDRAAGWLFRATGQYVDLPESWTQPISEAGFQVRREEVSLDRSKVIQLVATRSGPEGQNV